MRDAPPSAERVSSGAQPAKARRPRVGRVLAAWCALAVGLAVLVALSNPLSKGEYPGPDHLVHLGVLRGWYQFDAGWYEVIATRGYYLVTGQSPVAFFPAYPLAVRGLRGLFGGNVPLTAIAVTFACGAGAVGLFTLWVRDHLNPRPARYAVALLVVYPYSWYLVGAVYADAFFLLFALAAFVALERDHPVLAGLLGAVAAATRPVGPAVVLGLAVLAVERRGALRTLGEVAPTGTGRLRRLAHRLRLPCGVDRHRLRPADAGVLLAALGFVAYSGWLWWRYGDPFAFSTVQRYWDQPTGPVTWVKAHLWGNLLLHFPSKARYLLGCLLQGALTIGAILCVPRIARRLGWGYALVVLVGMGLPALGSKDFQGTGRYLLAAFPVFALAGEWLADRPAPVQVAVLGTSTVLLVLWTHLYARGFYVA